MQCVSMRITESPIIAQSLHPGDANAEVDEPFAPGTSECIRDQNRNGKFGALLQRAMKFAGGPVGIAGQEHSVTSAIDVGDIDAAVGADEPVMRLGDQHAVLTPNDGAASRRASSMTRASRLYFLAHATDSADGLIVARSTMHPSDLETILCLTTRMSPARIQSSAGSGLAAIPPRANRQV